MSETITDPYLVLGVPADATPEQLRAAYRRRIRQTHPDMGGDPADAARVNQAWALLNDPHSPPTSTPEPDPTPDPGAGSPHAPPADTTHSQPPPPTPNIPPEVTDEEDRLTAAAHTPIRAWWARPWAWVPAVAWLIVMIVFVITGGPAEPMVWAAVGLYAAATWIPLFRRGLLLPAGALFAATAIEVVSITADTPTILALAVTVAVWIGVAIARRTQLHATYRALRAQYTLACTIPGVTGWLVLAVEPAGASTRCLLENETSGHHDTRSLWGRLEVGDRVALADGDRTDLPESVLPVQAQKPSRRARRR